MKIQIVSDRSIRYDCKYDITYSTLNKPKSLVLEYSLVVDTLKKALENEQIQPVMLKNK